MTQQQQQQQQQQEWCIHMEGRVGENGVHPGEAEQGEEHIEATNLIIFFKSIFTEIISFVWLLSSKQHIEATNLIIFLKLFLQNKFNNMAIKATKLIKSKFS